MLWDAELIHSRLLATIVSRRQISLVNVRDVLPAAGKDDLEELKRMRSRVKEWYGLRTIILLSTLSRMV